MSMPQPNTDRHTAGLYLSRKSLTGKMSRCIACQCRMVTHVRAVGDLLITSVAVLPAGVQLVHQVAVADYQPVICDSFQACMMHFLPVKLRYLTLAVDQHSALHTRNDSSQIDKTVCVAFADQED